MYVGIDDTDSRTSMCTTFICKSILDKLIRKAEIKDFPRLVRLNPNIPFKTRGNGALSFEVDGDPTFIRKTVKKVVRNNFVDDPNTNPGIVFIEESVPGILTDFYRSALHDIISIEEAFSLAREIGAKTVVFGNGRGVIGALAAIGADFLDHTYELIVYRKEENIGKPRFIDKESVKNVDLKYYPAIFDTYDWDNDYVAISPNASCPVLYGLRGNYWHVLEIAANEIVSESVYKKQVFLTNQATDSHIEKKTISEIKEYNSIQCRCNVKTRPQFRHKGHLFFIVHDNTGEIICAAYEPTKGFRQNVMHLMPGDLIDVWGGVKKTKYGLTINLEKMRIIKLVPKQRHVVPICCGKKMQSIGKLKGYRCTICKNKIPINAVKTVIEQRPIRRGLFEVPVIARRHLAKPLSRIR
ncbi:MAG: TiaS agmantine-binding domain-containing protein [Candidatus Methanofastidiosia archaeon]